MDDIRVRYRMIWGMAINNAVAFPEIVKSYYWDILAEYFTHE